MDIKESTIRDALAQNPSILEPGLSTIGIEHHVPNASGTRGFIDILAKDALGNRVIIELKRSNQAAREAIHEVFKYTTLFQQRHRLPNHRIRCIVVSLAWDELRIPFAAVCSLADFQISGFLLEVDELGAPTRAEKQLPIQLSEPIASFRDHCAFLYTSADARDRSLTQLSSAFVAAGGTAGFLLLLDAEPDTVHYSFAAYLVPAAIASEKRSEIDATLRLDADYADYGFDTPAWQLAIEEHFSSEVVKLADHNWDDFEIGYPEKIDSMLNLNWKVGTIQRIGGAPTAIAADDAQVLAWIRGLEGQNANRFYRITSPRLHLDWADTQAQMEHCLNGNEAWTLACRHTSQWIEAECPEATVAYSIYNPLCLPISLFKLLARGDQRYLPSLEILVHDSKRGRLYFFVGMLEWDGATQLRSLHSIFTGRIGDVEQFMFATGLHDTWHFDREIVQSHGLVYSVVRAQFVEQGEIVTPLEYSGLGETITAVERALHRCPLDDFVDANMEYLQQLVLAISASTVGL